MCAGVAKRGMVYVCERERDCVCLCACERGIVYVIEGERVCVCVKRERERVSFDSE